MKHTVEFKDFSPTPVLEELIERSVARLARLDPRPNDDTTSLRVVVEQNEARTLYRVAATAEVPRHTLAAHEERHDAEEAVHAVFADIRRQLVRHKEMLKAGQRARSQSRP